MLRLQLLLLIAIPTLAIAEKPDCKTVRSTVLENRKESVESLEKKLDKLNKLRGKLRRGRYRLPGKYGMKSRREQFKILTAKIQETEQELDSAKTAIKLDRFSFRDIKPGHFGSFGMGGPATPRRDFNILEIIDNKSFTAFLSYPRMVRAGESFRYVPAVGSTLYLVKGIDTKNLADGKPAGWSGFLCCSGTRKLLLKSGRETVFVLEPLDVEDCLKEKD